MIYYGIYKHIPTWHFTTLFFFWIVAHGGLSCLVGNPGSTALNWFTSDSDASKCEDRAWPSAILELKVLIRFVWGRVSGIEWYRFNVFLIVFDVAWISRCQFWQQKTSPTNYTDWCPPGNRRTYQEPQNPETEAPPEVESETRTTFVGEWLVNGWRVGDVMWNISQDKYPIEGPNMFGGHHFLLMLYGLCQVFFHRTWWRKMRREATLWVDSQHFEREIYIYL